ncbi:LTA synthase family protein [Aerococcaceae bacterium NML130460]|nr:LTA synthase family protein [Aerococcaceae bacterium NML130460]
MQWFVYLGSGLVAYMAHYSPESSLIQRIFAFIKGLLIVNTLTLFIIRWSTNRTDILLTESYQQWQFLLTYIGTAFGLIALSFFFKHFNPNWKKVGDPVVNSTNKWRIVFTWLALMAASFLVIFTVWFIEYFGKLTPEQFLFNLSSPIKGTAEDANHHIYTSVILAWVVSGIGFYYLLTTRNILTFGQRQLRALGAWLTSKRRTLFVSLSAVVLGLGFTVWQLKLVSVARAYLDKSTYIADNYVDPRNVTLTFPTKKRNLIHIYLESVENSFFDVANGGHVATNLMPEMLQLAKEGITFSHNDSMGGPYQTYGSSWSVASMVNMGNGVPLKVAMGGNSYGKSGFFLPGIYGIGDLLADKGYEQTIMFGADADFGGLTTYFKSHGNFNIWDVKHARDKGYIPQDYNVWWGFEDDKLFEFAKEEITRLANTGKPFNFIMETADTHFPDGYLSKNAPTPHDLQYANVIAYSSSEAYKFIRWIQKQPFYEDTVIVVTGDHLSMDKKFFESFDPSYHRTVLNFILNSSVETTHTTNRGYSPVDFFPTILASMGVEIEGERLGLGTNLFSEIPTLIERDGLELFDSELGKNSNFYNEEFVDEKGHTPFYQ